MYLLGFPHESDVYRAFCWEKWENKAENGMVLSNNWFLALSTARRNLKNFDFFYQIMCYLVLPQSLLAIDHGQIT